MANPNWKKGMPSPNPTGKAKPDRLAARTLAIACQEALTDDEVADILLTIADGEWPKIRRKGRPTLDTAKTLEQHGPVPIAAAPDGAQRLAALKEFLLRRDGMPMQSVVLKAEIDARARMFNGAADAIDVGELDPVAAAALEIALQRALAAPYEADPEPANDPRRAGVIDTTATETTP